jgi:hypothetical protein
MYIPRLLLLSLLISLGVAPVAAQSSPDKSPVSAQPKLDGLIAPPEFCTHAIPLPPNVRARIRAIQPQLSFDSTLAQDDTACYFIRSYRVTRDNPESDSTRLAGYSECQPAARFQVKAAVDSREIELR